MDYKPKCFFPILISLVFTISSILFQANPVLAKAKTREVWGVKELCSYLGEKEKNFHHDIDVYTFTGQKGEKVSLSLQANLFGSSAGELATLILTSKFKHFFKIDKGPLPNKISTVLPVQGKYFVFVIERFKNKSLKNFKGDYCLTLKSSKEAWKTFQPLHFSDWIKHPITWIPEEIKETVSQGMAEEIKVAFISQNDLKKVNLWITPELRPFLHLEPDYFEKIEAHTTYEVTLQLAIPKNINPGLYDGTVHLRSGHRTCPETLKIELEILGNLPPVANAGPDQIFVLPAGQTTIDVQLDAGASYDSDGRVSSYLWTGNPDPEDVVKPIVSLKQGIHDFTLQVIDDKGTSSSDHIKVTVLGPPLLMPLPEVIGEPTIRLQGISLPGTIIRVVNKNTGETKEAINEKGFFEINFDLAPGLNDFEAVALFENMQSAPARLKTTYSSTRNLILESISPSSGQSGSLITLRGSGFTPDKNIMGVYFKGSEVDGRPAFGGKGVVIEASATMLKVIVPFIFLKSEEDVEVYVHDGENMSNSLTFHIMPALDPTPDTKGNEVDYQLNLLLAQIQNVFNKLEQWTKPKVPPETWALIEENMERTQYFLETFKERVNSIPSEEVKANLDAIFGGEFFFLVTQQLEQVNEILSHTTPCDIARVIQILNQILEPINTLNRVLDGIKDTLIAIQVGHGIACFFGCVPCCAAIPFLYEVYSTVCAIDSVVDAIRSVFNTVIAMMNTAIPTIPSEWKVAVTGPFAGISNHILYTNTSSEIRLYANFTNAGFEQLIDMADLRIDIPDPGGVFSILSFIGIDIEAAIEEALGRLVLDLAVDLLDINEIRITFADINVSSTVKEQADPSRLVTVIGEGGLGESHTIIAGSSSGTGVLLDIQASCGNYHYPTITKCVRKILGICVEWSTDYPRYFDVEVIPVPYIQNLRWEQVNAWDPCCRYEPRGHYEECWKEEWIEGATCYWDEYCRYDNILGRWEGCWKCLDTQCRWVEDDPCTGCWKQKYNLVVEGKGLSSDPNTLKVYWNGELLNPYNYGDLSYNSFNLYGRYESVGYSTDFIGDKPGWLSVGVQDSTGNVRDTYGWLTWFVPPSPDLDAELSLVNSSLYPGDTLYVTGNYFTPYQADNLLDLSYEGALFQIRPQQSWVDNRSTQADVLAFQIPPFHEEGYSFDGKTLAATLKVGRSLPCQANNCDQDVIKILPYESAGLTSADDQDLMILGGQNSYLRSAAIGDLNGDGINDLVVGVPEYRDSTGHAIGAVFIAFGPVQGMPQSYGARVINTVDLFSANPAWDVMIVGDFHDIHSGGNSRRIGNSLAVSDTNGDGIDDLLIGTTDQDEFGNHKPNIDLIATTPGHVPGKAYLFFGRESWHREYHLFSGDYDVKFYGDNNRELGYQVGIGKIHGYGQYKDIVITAPTDSIDPNVPNSLVARAYIITGQIIEASFRQKKDVLLPNDLSNLHTSYYSIIEGKNYFQYNRSVQYKGDGMGKSLALGDINGDGLDDIVLGAPQFGREPNALPQGAVYILYGRPWTLTPPLPGYYYVDAKDEGDQDAAIIGPIVNSDAMRTGFAKSVHVVDLNGDGKGEIVIGAPAAKLVLDIYPSMTMPLGYQSMVNIRETGVGQVYVIDGANTNIGGTLLINKNADYIADLIINGSRSISSFGYSLSSGDIDNDGIKDLLVGAPGGNAGHVWVFYGDGRGRWRDTAGQDVVHLENRRWYSFENPLGVIGWYDYSRNSGTPLEEGMDYLFTGPRRNPTGPPGFGTFVATGDLYPFIGDDVMIIDPLANAPNAPSAGLLYIFHEGSTEYWPLTIAPETVNMDYCDSEQRFTVSGGLKPYQFSWRSCYIGEIGPPYVMICNEFLPSNFSAEYGENTVQLHVSGCIPNNYMLSLRVTDSRNESVFRAINFLKPDILVSPSSIDFGDVEVGWTSNWPITLSNVGTSNLQINGISLTGSSDMRQTNNCPQTLAPQGTCTINAIFNPTTGGPAAATISVISNDPDEGTININLRGNGIVVPDITGMVMGGTMVVGIGSSQSQRINVWNQGGGNLHISNVTLSGPSEFIITENTCTGTLSPPPLGNSCYIKVTFTPTNIYLVNATVSVQSNDPDEPVVNFNLAGRGVIVLPFISVTPPSIDFGPTSNSATLTIANTSSTQSLIWNITDDLPPWLSLSSKGGEINTGTSTNVTVTVLRNGLQPGAYTHTLTINSNAGSASVTVSMIAVSPLTVSPANVLLSLCGSEQVFSVSGGVPPYTIGLLSVQGEAVADSITLIDNGNGTATVRIAPCNATRNTSAAAVDSNVIETTSVTNAEMFISLYRNIPSGVGMVDVGEIVHIQCGADTVTLRVTDSIGLQAFASISFEGENNWSKTYGPWQANYIEETSDGSLIMGGVMSQIGSPYVSDIRVTKLSSTGQVQWDKQVSMLGAQDITKILQTSDGGYIILGGNLVIKLNSAGSIEWKEFVYGAIVYGPTDQTIGGTLFRALKETADGRFILAGTMDIYLRNENRIQSGMILVKLNSDGTGQWWKFYHQGANSKSGIFDLELTSDGFIAIGWVLEDMYSSSEVLPMLIKFDANGNIEWNKRYESSDYNSMGFYSIDLTSDGGYIIGGLGTVSSGKGGDVGGGSPPPGGVPIDGGDTPLPPEGNGGEVPPSTTITNLLVIKTDNSGTIQWQKQYQNVNASWIGDILSTDDGGYVIGLNETSANQDVWIVKIDSVGNIVWQKAYGKDAHYDALFSLRKTSDGGYIAAGGTYSFTSSDLGDAWILKIGPEGNCHGCGQ